MKETNLISETIRNIFGYIYKLCRMSYVYLNKGNEEMQENKLVTCFYHKNCNDGAFAALGIYRRLGMEDSLFTAIRYEDDLYLPKTNTDIYFVDFCPQPEDLINILKRVQGTDDKVVIIDHHKTAYDNIKKIMEDVPDLLDNLYLYIDQSKSGAQLVDDLAFDLENIKKGSLILNETDIINLSEDSFRNKENENEFNDESPINSYFIELLAVRDLWKSDDQDLKDKADALSNYLFLMKYFDLTMVELDGEIDCMEDRDVYEMIHQGELLLKKSRGDAEHIVLNCHEFQIGTDAILGMSFNPNEPSMSGSIFCNEKYKDRKAIFVSISVLPNEQRLGFSLRSNENIDAVKLVEKLRENDMCETGGGHKQACGASSNKLYSLNNMNIISALTACFEEIV